MLLSPSEVEAMAAADFTVAADSMGEAEGSTAGVEDFMVLAPTAVAEPTAVVEPIAVGVSVLAGLTGVALTAEVPMVLVDTTAERVRPEAVLRSVRIM